MVLHTPRFESTCGSNQRSSFLPQYPPQLRGANLTASGAASIAAPNAQGAPLLASLERLDLGDNPLLAWADAAENVFNSSYSSLFEL